MAGPARLTAVRLVLDRSSTKTFAVEGSRDMNGYGRPDHLRRQEHADPVES
jgi:hypothetical protein